MTRKTTCFAILALLASPLTAAADDEEAGKKVELAVGIGIDTVLEGQGAYARGYVAVTPTLLVNFSTFYVLDQGRIGGNADATEAWLEVGVEKRTRGFMMPKGQHFFREWRAGGFFQSDVVGLGGLLKSETQSKMLAVYGGVGGGMAGGAISVTAALDLLVAPLITEGDYYDDTLGEPVTYTDDGPSRFGGKFDMKINMGKPNYGFAFDVQLGYRPGIERSGLAVATLGIYFAI